VSNTWYITTGDGDDVFGNGHTRAHSFQTLNRLLQEVPKGAATTFQISKYRSALTGIGSTAIAVYNAGTAYAVGNRCTSNGYVFKCTAAATGVQPDITTDYEGAASRSWVHENLVATSKGNWAASVDYAVGDTVKHTATGLTYICIKAHTSAAANSATNKIPQRDGNNYWQVCGEYNPVINEAISAYNFNHLALTTGDPQVRVIYTSTVNLSYNASIRIEAPLTVGTTLTLNYVGSWYMYNNGTMQVGKLTTSQTGGGTILCPVKAWQAISHEVAGTIFYYEKVSIVTDTLAQCGLWVQSGSNVFLYNTLTIDGHNVPGETANSGSGIYALRGGRLTTYGNIVIGGFCNQIYANMGGEIHNRSDVTTLSKSGGLGTNTTATCYAIKVADRSLYVKEKGTTITRNNSLADSISTKGTYLTY
jgi:hypothetical protein